MSEWPAPIAEPASHGPVGEFVKAVEPHTEADPVALLIQCLVAFDVAAGRHAHLRIEGSHHVLEEVGRLRHEIRQPDRGRSAEVWIPVLADAA